MAKLEIGAECIMVTNVGDQQVISVFNRTGNWDVVLGAEYDEGVLISDNSGDWSNPTAVLVVDIETSPYFSNNILIKLEEL